MAYETIWNPFLISFWRIFCWPQSLLPFRVAFRQMFANTTRPTRCQHRHIYSTHKHKLFIGFLSLPFICLCIVFGSETISAVSESFAAFACYFAWNGGVGGETTVKEDVKKKKLQIKKKTGFFLQKRVLLYLPFGFCRRRYAVLCTLKSNIIFFNKRVAHAHRTLMGETSRRWTCVGEWA